MHPTVIVVSACQRAAKATFTESPLGRVLRLASCHRPRFNSSEMMSSADFPLGMIGLIGQDSWSVSRSAFRAD